HRHVKILFRKLRQGPECDPRWIVDRLPLILAAHDQVSQKNAGDRSVGHPVTRITCGNEDVFFIKRVWPDKSQTINWFQHLSRPAIHDLLDHRKAMPRPAFQGGEALVSIVLLTSLMIFSAHNQYVISLRALTYCFDADVVIGIRGVP